MRYINSWKLIATWDDGMESNASDCPDYVAKVIDAWLDKLEEKRNE
tara:strand:- start:1148 stop:1285 length:138 start_codon:yes stop_codon:yes gene_type:complete